MTELKVTVLGKDEYKNGWKYAFELINGLAPLEKKFADEDSYAAYSYYIGKKHSFEFFSNNMNEEYKTSLKLKIGIR